MRISIALLGMGASMLMDQDAGGQIRPWVREAWSGLLASHFVQQLTVPALAAAGSKGTVPQGRESSS